MTASASNDNIELEIAGMSCASVCDAHRGEIEQARRGERAGQLRHRSGVTARRDMTPGAIAEVEKAG